MYRGKTLWKLLFFYCVVSFIADVSPCNINPCEHGGTCLRQDITQNYVCTCLPGYTGNYCDTGVLSFVFFKSIYLKYSRY